MKIYRIKHSKSEQFLSKSTKNWTESGTTFTSLNAARKALSYQKAYCKRHITYYANSAYSDYKKRMEENLAKINDSIIVEYEAVPNQEFNAEGISLSKPNNENDAKKDPDSCDILDRVDFTKIKL